VILGGGTIGLEVAASLRAAGVTVTVVERAHRLLARTASETMAAWLRTRHEAQGVVFHLGRTAVEIEGKDRKVSAVLLDDGTRIACDAVLSCVGVEPDTGLAVQAGLSTTVLSKLIQRAGLSWSLRDRRLHEQACHRP